MDAAVKLFQNVGAEVVGTACMIELTFLNGKERLGDIPFDALVSYDD